MKIIDADEYLKSIKPKGISDKVWEESELYKSIANAPTIEPNLVINPDEVKRGDVTMIGMKIVVMHYDDYMEMMLKSAAVDDGSWERFAAEPCEDAISRKDALIALKNAYPSIPFTKRAKETWEREYKGYIEASEIISKLPPVAPSRRGGDWIDLFEEIGNTIDTIGDGQETEAFNRGIEACAEIVRRFFGLDMRQESEWWR